MRPPKNSGHDPFAAIGDRNRRQMLHLLSKEDLSINALAENFDMSRPAVSKHIKILYLAGFIAIRDIGRERRCTLNQKGFATLRQWIDHYDLFWHSKLQKLEKVLHERSKKTKAGKN